MSRCACASERRCTAVWPAALLALAVALFVPGCFTELRDRACESAADCLGGEVCGVDGTCVVPVGDDGTDSSTTDVAPVPALPGRVVDTAGLPVIPARVCVYASGMENAQASIASGPEGHFELTGLVAGESYTVFVFQCALGQHRIDDFDASRASLLEPVVLAEAETLSPCDISTCPPLSALP